MANRPIYLDHHATTPTDPRVVEAMLPFFTTFFGNPASVHHAYGWEAADAVETAREQVQKLIGALSPSEITFTSGATEANNLALKGAARALRARGDHLVASAVEHRSVLDPLRRLAREEGWKLTLVHPDQLGRVHPEAVLDALTPSTVLVSVIAANNEIGTINPIREIGQLCRDRGVLFHTDATQAVGKIPLDVEADHIDLLSFSGHKIYGPKGIGVLHTRRRAVRLSPLVDGGGHERGLRSGTLAVPLIVGLGTASEIALHERDAEALRIAILRDQLHALIHAQLEGQGFHVHGDPAHRLPGNLHLGFDGVSGQGLLLGLNGLAVSSGAACSSAEPQPSHVLRAIGIPEDRIESSLRFGLGRFTTTDEIQRAAQIVTDTVLRLRRRGPWIDPGHPSNSEQDVGPSPCESNPTA